MKPTHENPDRGLPALERYKLVWCGTLALVSTGLSSTFT